jgi:carbon monoxide dehydrogenase subunit G
MKIDNSFNVSVPVDRAWELLTDLEGVALCLPGAQVTGVEGDVYKGEVRIKVGPVVSQYAGTAQFVEKDDALHRAVIDAKGRDSRGAGNASAMITVQLRADGDHTAATVDTDMKISGKIAQLGGGMIKDVSEKLLGQFVECLEAKFAASPPSGGPAAAEPSGTPAAAEPSEPVTLAGPSGTPAAATSSEPPTTQPPTTQPPTTQPPSAEAPVTGQSAVTGQSEAPTSSAGPTSSGGTSSAAPTSNAARRLSAQPTPPPEPLDLMALAGGTMVRRLLPVVLGAVVAVAAVVVYLTQRGARGTGR